MESHTCFILIILSSGKVTRDFIKLISVGKEHVTANTLISEVVPQPVPEPVQSALWVRVIPDGPSHEDVLTEAAARVCVRGSPFLKTDA